MATVSTDAATPPQPRKKKPFHKDLFGQVIIAVVLGIIVGDMWPQYGDSLKPLGDAFISLIKMMIGPIIFCTIVSGIAGVGCMKQAGRVGIKALIYFEVVTTLALVLGIVATHVYTPSVATVAVDADALMAAKGKMATHMTTTTEFLMNIIPHTFISALTEGEILQVLLVALLFSAGVSMMGDAGKPVVHAVESFSKVVFNIITLIIKLAPIGVFGAIAYSVSKFGISSLKDLGALMLLFFGSCILFVTVVLGGIMRFYCKLSLWQLIRYIREEIAISFGTASSESVLPRMIEKMTKLGCAKPVVGMVLPTGYSFNLDGTSLYLTLAAMFVASVAGVDLTWGQQATILAVLLITSKGAAAVYGAAFVVLTATLNTLQVIPEEQMAVGLALLFAIDRFMAPGRVLTNLIGNSVATIVVAKWEKQLDHGQAKEVLSNAGKSPRLIEPVASVAPRMVSPKMAMGKRA